MKTETTMKNKIKTKMKIHFDFHFRFCFHFLFLLFLLSKSLCIFANSTWPRGAIDSQLSLNWPRSVVAFSFANFARGLPVQ